MFTQAIDCFGFDPIDKVFLIWDEGPFWAEDTLGFQFLWTTYDDAFFKVTPRVSALTDTDSNDDTDGLDCIGDSGVID